MRLQIVGGQTLILNCIKCQGKVSSDLAFADLDGEPFKAYYCPDCARKVQVADLDRFTAQYIETALWSSTYGEDDTPMDDTYDIPHFSIEAIETIKADCARFQSENSKTIDQCEDTETCGHDFWLTRNRHGAGFWDGDYPEEIGEALTEASHRFGESNLYIGDDEQVHVNG